MVGSESTSTRRMPSGTFSVGVEISAEDHPRLVLAVGSARDTDRESAVLARDRGRTPRRMPLGAAAPLPPRVDQVALARIVSIFTIS